MGMLHNLEVIKKKNCLFMSCIVSGVSILPDDLAKCLGYFNGHIGRYIDGFDGVHGGYGVGQRNLEGRMLSEFCLEKELCVSNTWFMREEKRMVTFRMDKNDTKIDFVFIKKEDRRFF